MKVLITGINGFIGTHLAHELIFRKHSVVGLGLQEKCQVGGVSEYFSGDVLDSELVKKAAKGVDAIIHLAALIGYGNIEKNKFETLEVNLAGTRNVLEAFSKSKSAKKFIFSSTGKVYGTIKSVPITEAHPVLPLNLLGKSKLITERLIDFYANDEKSFVIFRIFNVYGEGQRDAFLVPQIMKQLKDSDELALGDIKAKRDYIYIKDVVNAFALAIEKETGNGLATINIASCRGTSAEEIVALIGKIKGMEIKITSKSGLQRKDEMNTEYGSYKKAKKVLGWEPKYSLEEGLKRVCEAS